MRRGDVWWAEQPEPIGRRPVVLLSRDEAYKIRNAVTIGQITTTIRNIPVEVVLDKEDGLSRKSVINLDTIATVKKSILLKRICSLKKTKIKQLEKALKFSLAL